MALIRVLNKNNTVKFKDKYGGVEYVFPPGEPKLIPEDAAEHIWGWGLDEKGRFKKMMRMGLANAKDGKKIWDNVVLKANTIQATGKEREVREDDPYAA